MENIALQQFFKECPKELYPKCIVLEHNHSKLWKDDLIKSLIKYGYSVELKNRSNYILTINK